MFDTPSGVHAYAKRAEQDRRDKLILSHLPLVKHVLGRIMGGLPSGADVENLEAAGVLGLVEAASKFDPTRNAQFKTFAYMRVRGAIFDELRRNSPLPQQIHERIAMIRKAQRSLAHPVTVDMLAEATGLTPDAIADALAAEKFARPVSWDQSVDEDGNEPFGQLDDDPYEKEEAVQELADAISRLTEQERTAITLYYREDLRLQEMSAVMNLSMSRISRILSKATFELGEMLKSRRSAIVGC